MCYAIPGRVVSIESNIATLSYFGELRRARNELPNLEPGQYAYAQGGFVIEALSGDVAEDLLEVWKESFFTLREEDLRLSMLPEQSGVSEATAAVLKKGSLGVSLSDREAVYLMELQEEPELQLLFNTANFLRSRYQGNSCCVHGIVEYSSHCSRNCAYCGLSVENASLPRYRMKADAIEDAVLEAVDRYGFRALVLQGGEDSAASLPEMLRAVRSILSKRSLLLIVSPGEIDRGALEELYRAGVRGLLLRFETSDPDLYAELHPGYSLEDRLEVLRIASEIGYFIITGGIVGLPGQTPEGMVRDIRQAAEDPGAAMFSFGPFIPHPDTVLAGHPVCDRTTMLKVLSLIRILYPDRGPVLVTTALETLDAGARRKGLLCGANSLMLNATPEEYRSRYCIYPDRAHTHTPVAEQVDSAVGLLRGLGRAPTDLSFSEV